MYNEYEITLKENDSSEWRYDDMMLLLERRENRDVVE
jgi:hypothetical protein